MSLCRFARRVLSRWRGVDPCEVFPVEVVRLHEQGVPWPTWFAGPLNRSTPEIRATAMRELAAVRKAACAPSRPVGE
jgi:hypothetical protein